MLIATPSYTAPLVNLGPRAWFTARGTGTAGCKLRQEASLTSAECGEVTPGSKVRCDFVQELVDGKLRMHICEPAISQGWTTATLLNCHSTTCGICSNCATWYKNAGAAVLKASQLEEQRIKAKSKLQAERLACDEEDALRQAAESEVDELENKLARLYKAHRAIPVVEQPTSKDPEKQPPHRAVTISTPRVARIAKEAYKQLETAMAGMELVTASEILNPEQQTRIQALKEKAEIFKHSTQGHPY